MKGTYEELLEAAKADPEEADFTRLRMAYADSPQYNPYRRADQMGAAKIAQALQGEHDADDAKAARAEIERLLEADYLNADHHLFAAYVCHQLGDEDGERFHQTFMMGLLKSVLASGDGRSYETAFRVIATHEEYALMKALGLQPRGQELRSHEGHWYDVHRLRHPETGQEGEIFFNIDIPYLWLQNRLHGNPSGLDSAVE